jgi:hypothetical protein
MKTKVIDNKLRLRLQSTCSSLAVFYGLSKVHKTGYPLRPIISSIGSFQYDLSKYLAKALRDARPPAASFVKDSFELVRMIKDTALNKSKTYIMCSFDVESLYKNAPVKETIEAALKFVYSPKELIDVSFDETGTKRLLELRVCDAPFRFMEKTCVQIDGLAMENPLAPMLADSWMRKIEQRLNRFTTNKPIICIRYVDDVFALFSVPTANILEFDSLIKKWHKNLRFTVEFENQGTTPFLDVRATLDQHQSGTSL